jgi:hypothetical protein
LEPKLVRRTLDNKTPMLFPGMRAYWRLYRHRYDPGFAEVVDEAMARDRPTDDPIDFQAWTALLAEEKAAIGGGVPSTAS